jgi:hypothetical protein
MDLSALVQNFGFPVAAAVFFIWMFVSQAKEHKQDLKDIAVKSVQAIDAGTEAIRDSTATIEKNNTALNRVEMVLSQQKGSNGNGMGSGN